MSVFVDDMMAPFGRMKMCHMYADSHEELVAMADTIGVDRKWIQYPGHPVKEHFDIALSKRALAFAAGAVPTTWRQYGEWAGRRRAFPRLITTSRHEAEYFLASDDDVCISIRSTQRTSEPKLSAHFRGVLVVEFDDWPWTDRQPQMDQIRARQITEIDAERIVSFAREHRTVARMLVHCDAGVSRSVSTAMALSQRFAGKFFTPPWAKDHRTFLNGLLEAKRIAPNPPVYTAILAAFDRLAQSW